MNAMTEEVACLLVREIKTHDFLYLVQQAASEGKVMRVQFLASVKPEGNLGLRTNTKQSFARATGAGIF